MRGDPRKVERGAARTAGLLLSFLSMVVPPKCFLCVVNLCVEQLKTLELLMESVVL